MSKTRKWCVEERLTAFPWFLYSFLYMYPRYWFVVGETEVGLKYTDGFNSVAAIVCFFVSLSQHILVCHTSHRFIVGEVGTQVVV